MRRIRTALLLLIALVGVLFGASFSHSLTEQIVSKSNSGSLTGYVTRAPLMRNQDASSIGEIVVSPSDETSANIPARNVVLGFTVLAFVTLVGFLVSQYHGGTSTKPNTKKGTIWIGRKARTRVIRSPIENYIKKVRSNRRGTEVSQDLEIYLRGRKQQAVSQVKTARPSESTVSSYEDEYWQHQKESFWKRVRNAAEAPMTIQQLAVKRVQQYNEKMAEIRKAKEDLYGQKAQTTTAPTAEDVEVEERSPVEEKGFSRWGGRTMREEQQLIIDQLREAHYYE